MAGDGLQGVKQGFGHKTEILDNKVRNTPHGGTICFSCCIVPKACFVFRSLLSAAERQRRS